jgi:hypothetical protein
VSVLLFVVLVCVGLGAPVVARLRTGDAVHPIAVVLAVWAPTLGLFYLRMLGYPTLSPAAAGVLALGIGSLFAGIVGGRPLAARGNPRVWPVAGPAVWVAAYALLGIVGTGWYVWEVDRLLGWRALLNDALHIRIALRSYDIPSRFLFLQFFCIIAPLLAVGLTLGGVRLRPWHWILVGLCVAGTWLTTDRTQCFTVVLTSLFMYFFRWGRDLTWSKATGGVVLCAAVLLANFFVVGQWRGGSTRNLGFALTAPRMTAAEIPAASPAAGARAPADGKAANPANAVPAPASPVLRDQRTEAGVREPVASSPAVREKPIGRGTMFEPVLRHANTLYLYSTASYAAFSLWYPSGQPLAHGVHTFYPIARLLERVGLISGPLPPAILGFAKVVRRGTDFIEFNTYTFLYYPIADFGVAGMSVFCIALGLLIGVVYERTRRARSSALHLLVMGQISFALVLSMFVNRFNGTAAWYQMVWTALPFLATALASRIAASRAPAGSPVSGTKG